MPGDLATWRGWLQAFGLPPGASIDVAPWLKVGLVALGVGLMLAAHDLPRKALARLGWRGRAPVFDPSARRYWVGRPNSLGDRFCGREKDLHAVQLAAASGRMPVITGGPGMGKSQLAAEYAHRSGAPGFWTAAGDTVPRTLAVLAPSMGIRDQGLSEDETGGLVRAALGGVPKGTLWVVDNVTSLRLAGQLADAVPPPVRLVITSRDSRTQVLPRAFAPIELEPIAPNSAIALLCSRPGSRADPADPLAAPLTDRVGRLPLALEVLAARLTTGRTTPSALLAELDAAANLAQLSPFRERLDEIGANIAHPGSVFTVLAGALAALPSDARFAIAPLGYLADAPIPDPLLAACLWAPPVARGSRLAGWWREARTRVRHLLRPETMASGTDAG